MRACPVIPRPSPAEDGGYNPVRPMVPSEWIRGPVDELAIRDGCWFDEPAGLRAIRFVETFCKQSKGRWAGKPLILLDWQKDFLMRLFGWKRADGTRRYRTAYLEVAKKNGKSTLISAISLLMLLADNEGAPEVYLNAVDREQASIVFDEASRMVKASPGLSKRLDVIDSKKRIVDPKGHGFIRANSADVASKDGVNAHLIIFDELHRQKSRALWEIFEYASEARDQPLKISITTAGESEDGVWFEQRKKAEDVNAGRDPDWTFLGVVYRASPDDDPESPETWRKANPSLGATLKYETFRESMERAKANPVEWRNWLRLRLNIIVKAEGKYFEPSAWAACGEQNPTPLGELDGAECVAGVDLSSTTDLTAVVALFGNQSDGYDVHAWFFMPEDRVEAASREDNKPYGFWVQQGWITATDGNVIDYEAVRAVLRDQLAGNHDLKAIFMDPWNATHLANQLQSDGLNVVMFRQGFASASAPTKELDRLMRAGKLRHGDNPVLTMCVLNAVADKDAHGNVKLSKRKSRERIDGAAALVNATAAASDPNILGDHSPSPYDTRTVEWL